MNYFFLSEIAGLCYTRTDDIMNDLK